MYSKRRKNGGVGSGGRKKRSNRRKMRGGNIDELKAELAKYPSFVNNHTDRLRLLYKYLTTKKYSKRIKRCWF